MGGSESKNEVPQKRPTPTPTAQTPQYSTPPYSDPGRQLRCNRCGINHGPNFDCRPQPPPAYYAPNPSTMPLTVPCPNSAFGCPHHVVAALMPSHYESCQFGVMTCPLGKYLKQCSWKERMKNLYEHASRSHPNNTKYKVGEEVDLRNINLDSLIWNIQVIEHEGQTFIFHLNIDVWACCAVQFVGPPELAETWTYKIVIYKKGERAKTATFLEKCTSHEVDINSIFANGSCAVLPKHVLANYVQDNNVFHFKFYVRKYQEKDDNKCDRNVSRPKQQYNNNRQQYNNNRRQNRS